MIITAETLAAGYVEKPFDKGDTLDIYYNDSYDKRLTDGSHEIVFLGMIRFYQHFISPAQGEVCNFTPSCSNYMFQAIRKYGPVLGIMKGIDRMQRCNFGVNDYVGIYYPRRVLIKNRGYKLIDNP